MPAEMKVDRLADEVERLTKINGELVIAVEWIMNKVNQDGEIPKGPVLRMLNAALTVAREKP